MCGVRLEPGAAPKYKHGHLSNLVAEFYLMVQFGVRSTYRS